MWGRRSSRRGIESLRARRRRARLRLSIELILLALVIAGSLIWLAWQPYLRVSRVEVFGADQSLAAYAQRALPGSYLGIVPRDSILFVPEAMIRHAILADHPEIAALSIARTGFTALSIGATSRVAVARWCGLAPSTEGEAPYCYLFDGNGYIFAALSEDASATPPTTLNSFVVYDSLEASSTEPLRATLSSADELPDAFAFARKMGGLGSPAEAVVIRPGAGEADDLLASGTRITYVLGEEQHAYSALTAALKDLDLSDGSVSYIDLRFPGDVYVKRAGR